MLRHQLTVTLALLSAVLASSLPAQDTVAYEVGTKLRLQRMGERAWIIGGVRQISPEVIVLDSSWGGATLVVPWTDIDRAQIRVQTGLSTFQRFTLIVASTISGAAAGAALGGNIGARQDRHCHDGPFCGASKEITAGAFGALGALGGLSFGATWDRERWRLLVRPQAR